jgi:photosystem II stability/assembly factor-like uncharacterized protein
MKRIVVLAALAALAVGPSFAAGRQGAERRLSEPLRTAGAAPRASVPMTFTVANDAAVEGRAAGAAVSVAPDAVQLAVGDARVAMRLVGAAETRVEPVAPRPGESNFLVGDRSEWRTNVATFGGARLVGAYPGVALTVTGAETAIGLEVEVAPGASAANVRLAFDAEAVRVDPRGNALLSTADGALVLSAPRVASASGASARFEKSGERELALVFVGLEPAAGATATTSVAREGDNAESDEDEGWDVAVDAAGNTYVAGATRSLAFPVVGGVQTTHGGAFDAFVTKLDPAGRVVYSTFLGGSEGDGVHGLTVDGAGNIYVTGSTASTNFPVANAIQPSNNSGCDFVNGCFDAFVAKLDPTGSQLLFSTYLGGENDEDGNKIRVDASGNITVVGSTNSQSFPTANAVQPNWGGGFCGPFACPDAFVAKLTPTGSGFVYSTYLGGFGYDVGEDVAVDAAGNAVLTGATGAGDFPLVGAPQGRLAGEYDSFVAKIASSGKSLDYSTYLGGIGYDFGRGVVLDASGNAYVAGWSESLNYPSVNALQGPHGGVFASTTGGQSWSAASEGLKNTYGISGIAVDPTNAAVAYVGTSFGVFKTTDGGVSWRPTGRGLPSPVVTVIAVDPQNPAIVYAGTLNGVGKSVDGGATWRASSNGLPEGTYLPVIAIDPQNPSTVLVFASAGGVYKSTDGGANWSQKAAGVINLAFAFTFDPTSSQIVYAAGFGNVFKSTDNGETWAAVSTGLPTTSIYGVAVDPTATSNVYAGSIGDGIFKSTDGGASWSALAGSPQGIITSMVADPAAAGTVYATVEGDRYFRIGKTAGGPEATAAFAAPAPSRPSTAKAGGLLDGPNGGVFKTTDGGQTWVPAIAGLGSNSVNEIAVSPTNPQALYVSTGFRGDATLTKLDAEGRSIVYSTFVGGNDEDIATDIAIDAAGNLYLSGHTWSLDFPTTSAVQGAHASPLFSDGFVLKLNGAATAILGATYVGGSDDESLRAVALGPGNAPVVAGWSYSDDFPLVSPHQPVFSGGLLDAVVSRLAPDFGSFGYSTYLGGFRDTPVIEDASLVYGRFVVEGSFFDNGATVYIANTRQVTRNFPDMPTEVLIVGKPSVKILTGSTVKVQVRNANGKWSEPFFYTRPAQ